jgi:serine/threonine protein kinase
VPGYITIERIGEGASGTVYKVIRAGTEHPLALKIMHVRLGQDAASRRAWRELHVLESLRLPVIPHLHEFGEYHGRLYIITDLIEGCPPGEWSDVHRLDRRGRVRLLADIADAVHTLHEQGVIHRDLKPGNIMITPAGRVVVLDLGLAVLVAQNMVDTLTVDGQAVGTPAYVAPEQARGERGAVGIRADVYSIGAIGYYLLTGSTPHDVNTTIHEAIRRVGSEEPRDPRALEPTLPRALSAVLAKAVARSPASRYPSAAALSADLRRWLAGEPVLAAPPSPWQRAVRWAGRHPLWVTAAACLIIGVTTLGFSALTNWFLFRDVHRVVVDRETCEVRLESRMGDTLKSWRSRSSDTIPIAALTRLAPQHGGERVLLLSKLVGDEFSPANASLACFRLRDVMRQPHLPPPLWVSGYRSPEIESPPEVHRPEDRFKVQQILIEDVFTDVEHPGDEVVALHIHEHYGRTAIRVYAAHSGAVLYEAWHSGSFDNFALIRDNDGPLLIAAAISNPHSVMTDGRGNLERVRVAFSLRLRPGEKNGYINLRSERPQLPVPDVQWYRFLRWPGETVLPAQWSIDLEVGPEKLYHDNWSPDGPGSINLNVLVNRLQTDSMQPSPRSRAVCLKVSPDGRVIAAIPTDSYRVGVEHEIPADSWRLDPEPPWPLPPFPVSGVIPWP